MPANKQQVAQCYYLAQLQAVKSGCECNACKLLRKATDAMTEEVLNPEEAPKAGIEAALELIKSSGYQVSETAGEDQVS